MHARKFLQSYFIPKQFGAGAKCGTETVVHTTRQFLTSQPESTILKVDFANAFNSIDRHWLLSQVCEQKVPGLNFIVNAYKYNSTLSFNAEMITSERGVQQGDPLGPLLFCLAIHPIVKSLKSKLNLWYMDDGIMGGTEVEVMEDYHTIKDRCEEFGLFLNVGKCEMFNGSPHLYGFKPLSSQSLTLLGCPVLSDSIDTVLNNRLKDFTKISKELHRLPTHHAYVTLKSSLGLCRFMSTLRSAPCLDSNVVENIDKSIKKTFESSLNIRLSSDSSEQASLPIKMGGMGIGSLKNNCIPAYLASLYSVNELYNLNIDPEKRVSYSKRWSGITGCDLPKLKMEQKSWSQPIHETILQRLFQSDNISNSRLNSCSHKYSGDWLHCLPNKALGLQLTDEEFRLSSCLRLGLPFFDKHKCTCGSDIDEFGIHCFACKRNNGKILRHTTVNEVISRALKSAHCPNLLEPSHISENLRPDGVTTIPFKCGVSLAWDFTCPHPLVNSALAINKERSGLANNKENKKQTKYASLSENYSFCPIAIDSIGAYGHSAQNFVKEVGKRMYHQTGQREATFFLRQRISITIQKGNAISLHFCLH